MSVTREQLHEQVWAKPMLAVAQDNGVSSNYLARVCASLNVPWPPRGYWAKVAAGQKPRHPALPPAGPGDQVEWTKGAGLDVPLSPPRRKAVQPTASVEPSSTVQSPAPPARHALVTGVREFFEIDRQTEFGYLRPRKRLLVDIVVSKAMLPTALDVANELFLMMERHGHRVALASGHRYWRRPVLELEGKKYDDSYSREPCRPDRPTLVSVKSVLFGLTLYESSAPAEVQYVNGAYIPVAQLTPVHVRWIQRNHSWTSTHHLPTGRLTLRAYAAQAEVAWQREWPERKAGELPHRFSTIRRELTQAVPEIEQLIDKARQEAEERTRQWEIQRAKHEREERERYPSAALKESREQLLAIVERWALARRTEDFFEDAQRRAGEVDEAARRDLVERLDTARQLLGGVDALGHFSAWKSPAERRS